LLEYFFLIKKKYSNKQQQKYLITPTNPFSHNIMQSLINFEIISVAGIFSSFFYENYTPLSFFLRKERRQISLILKKLIKKTKKQKTDLLFND